MHVGKFGRHHMSLWVLCFWLRRVSRPQKVTTTNNFRSIKVDIMITWFLPILGKKYIYQLVGKAIFKLERLSPWRPVPRCCWTNRDLFHFASHRPSLRNDGSSRHVPWPFQPVPGVFRLRSVLGPRKKAVKICGCRCYTHSQHRVISNHCWYWFIQKYQALWSPKAPLSVMLLFSIHLWISSVSGQPINEDNLDNPEIALEVIVVSYKPEPPNIVLISSIDLLLSKFFDLRQMFLVPTCRCRWGEEWTFRLFSQKSIRCFFACAILI